MPGHAPASSPCFLQERVAAKASEKEGELAAALSEKGSQIIQLQKTVDTNNAAAEKMLVPVFCLSALLCPFLGCRIHNC